MGRGDGVNERLLENENNRLSDQLAGKISKLKQISIEMKVRSFTNKIRIGCGRYTGNVIDAEFRSDVVKFH